MDYLEIQAEPSAGNLASSSSSVASRLYLNGTQRSSRRNSFSSEPELMNFSDEGTNNLGFSEVSNQMSSLTKKLTEMQEMQMATNEEKSRLRTENAVLQERVHLLEEQFQASEQRWAERLEEEKLRTREVHSRFEREKQLQAESGSLRCQMLEKDLNAVTKERDRLEESSRETQQKLRELRNQLLDIQHECERHETEKKQIKSEFERYRRDATDRMENSSEMLEELTRQSEMSHLKHSSLNHQGSLTDQIILLEDEIERLRLDNRELREQNMDLQAQILHDQVECGRNLLADGPPSLAAELTGMDSQGLMNTLKEQEIVNQRLRNYVNGILMRIIERHPDILEIKEEEFTENGCNSDSFRVLRYAKKGVSQSQPTTPPSGQQQPDDSYLRRDADARSSLRSPNTNHQTDGKQKANRSGVAPTTNFARKLLSSFAYPEWTFFRSSTAPALCNEDTHIPPDPCPAVQSPPVIAIKELMKDGSVKIRNFDTKFIDDSCTIIKN